jgi:hypothetical protein
MEKPLISGTTTAPSGATGSGGASPPTLAELPETPDLNLSGNKIQTATRSKFDPARAAGAKKTRSGAGRR